jgi:elongation factor 3
VVKALADKKSPAACEGTAAAVSTLVSDGAVHSLEPIFIDSGIHKALLEAFADKMPVVRRATIEAARFYLPAMNP